jgi:hypothetical protein
LKTGVKKDGTLVAKHMEVLVDAGAYSDHTIGEAIHAISFAPGPYRIPHCSAHVRDVYTNNPDWGCMRGYGALESQFATESQMDDIAARLGMDPVDFRLKNLCQDGDLKIILTQNPHRAELYDLTSDPEEQNNLAFQDPDLLHQMTNRLLEFEKNVKTRPQPDQTLPSPQQTRELLKTLGYTGR